MKTEAEFRRVLDLIECARRASAHLAVVSSCWSKGMIDEPTRDAGVKLALDEMDEVTKALENLKKEGKHEVPGMEQG